MNPRKLFSFCLLVAGTVLIHSVGSAAPLMVEKNLFAQDRKPPAPESAQSPGQAPKPGMEVANIQLDGVMIQGDTKKALVRLKNAAPAKKGQSPFMTVTEGQQLGDLRVAKIEAKSISVEKDGQTYTINLLAENKVVAPPAQPPPVPQPAPAPATAPGQPPEMGGNPPEQAPQPQAGIAQRRAAGQGFPQHMPPPNPGSAGFQNNASDQQIQSNMEQGQPEQVVEEPVPEEVQQ